MLKNIIRTGFVFVVVTGLVCLYTTSQLPDTLYFRKDRDIRIKSVPAITLTSDKNETSSRVSTGERQIYTAKLFGILPVKEVAVVWTGTRYVNVSGKPFGIKMFCDGVMVVGFSDILTRSGYFNPAKSAGLKTGDIITHIDSVQVRTNEDVEKIITGSNGKPLEIQFVRDGKIHSSKLTAARDSVSEILRSGMWVRDSGAGIGTMTFYDTQTGYFAGLGHGIRDADTMKELPLLSGEIVPVKITGIVKSRNGSAGQLKGSFTTTRASGKLLYNGRSGVYGKAYGPDKDNVMPVADPASVKPGPAYILTTINNSVPQMYTVEIEKVNLTAEDNNKNMVIRITDSRLLALTGGIVAGMSGSPIIQNGRLAGAVTHVFVNNVERGYGIFARNMINTLDSVARNENEKAA
ncbi:MAG: SpoIVB peptidase [Oscillospiraceae bacterium]|nr:SpoIVB peptidase [Oscillospiraceae bacterium]